MRTEDSQKVAADTVPLAPVQLMRVAAAETLAIRQELALQTAIDENNFVQELEDALRTSGRIRYDLEQPSMDEDKRIRLRRRQREALRAVGAMVDSLRAVERRAADLQARLRTGNDSANRRLVQQVRRLTQQITEERLRWSSTEDSLRIAITLVTTERDSVTHVNRVIDAQRVILQARLDSVEQVYWIAAAREELIAQGLVVRRGFLRKRSELLPVTDTRAFNVAALRDSVIPLPTGIFAVVGPNIRRGWGLGQNPESLSTAVRIANPQLFWSASRYLILEKK